MERASSVLPPLVSLIRLTVCCVLTQRYSKPGGDFNALIKWVPTALRRLGGKKHHRAGVSRVIPYEKSQGIG